ncbi:MAG: creatininase family protein [Candidatus Sabulitectum sp.]|nr:creatininase family protein [Candidatus Sabulitectum sp.]
MNLIESLSAEVENASRSMILLPAGSLEQHGTEAPLGCDGIIAGALCREAGLLTSTPVLPTLYYGYSLCHSSFPGTFTLSEKTYSKLLVEIINEAARNKFNRILILSGHGGNRKGAERAISETQGTISSHYLGYWQLPGVQEKENLLFRKSGYHVTASEVSLVWYLLSGSIPGVFTGTYPPAVKNISEISPEQWKDVYPDGGVGTDLSDASVSKGKILFEFITDSLIETIRRLE